MGTLSYRWRDGNAEHEFRLVQVPGTGGEPYLFGRDPNRRPIHIPDFHIGDTQVTQALWEHVMGSNPARVAGARLPVEGISWEDITRSGGFLDRLNESPILSSMTGDRSLRFRLPSETEWEYAARGGPHWKDGFAFSGSNDPDAVAWYGARWTGGALKWALMRKVRQIRSRLFGGDGRSRTQTHEVATKAPNQLGLYDMSGNVWEWCQDVCVDDINLVPQDGSPYFGDGDDRRLRGGCHHNWDIHCTVYMRYGIVANAGGDGCLGLRVVLAPA